MPHSYAKQNNITKCIVQRQCVSQSTYPMYGLICQYSRDYTIFRSCRFNFSQLSTKSMCCLNKYLLKRISLISLVSINMLQECYINQDTSFVKMRQILQGYTPLSISTLKVLNKQFMNIYIYIYNDNIH